MSKRSELKKLWRLYGFTGTDSALGNTLETVIKENYVDFPEKLSPKDHPQSQQIKEIIIKLRLYGMDIRTPPDEYG